jgi:anti-sigma factor RsiW
MTDQTHPSLDDLADLREGLLPSPHARDLAAHLGECETCSTASAALDDVTRVLLEAASNPTPMPGSVAASLDEALHRASRERTAAVPSLAQYRASSRPETVPARRSRWAWVAGAAAAVAIGYAGVNVLDGTPDSELSTADSGADGEVAEERDAVRSRPETATGKDSPIDRPRTGYLRTLNRKTLPGFAELVATTKQTDGGSRVRDCPSVDVSDDERATVVRWRGARAVVVVDQSNRRATVYRCTGDADRLFTTGY